MLGLLRTVCPPDGTTGNVKLVLLALYLVLSIALAALVARWYSNPLNRFFRAGSAAGPEPTAALQ